MGTCTATGGEYNGARFSAEQHSNTLDLIDNATVVELMAVDGVNGDVARQIAAGRPWFEFPDPLDAIGQLPAVDDGVMLALRDGTMDGWCLQGEGRQNCCLDISCEGLGGWIGEVEVLDWESDALLEWANNGTTEDLELVCGIGPSIAADIIAARPMRGVKEFDAVPYIGAATLQGILGRDGYGCETQGSIFEEWCSLDGTCTCDAE